MALNIKKLINAQQDQFIGPNFIYVPNGKENLKKLGHVFKQKLEALRKIHDEKFDLIWISSRQNFLYTKDNDGV